MSLFEKIDEMIRECNLPGGCSCVSDSVNSEKRKLLREIKHLILSEQKDVADTNVGKIVTIGDKIRESNDSLLEFIKQQYSDDRVFTRDGIYDIEDYINQPIS